MRHHKIKGYILIICLVALTLTSMMGMQFVGGQINEAQYAKLRYYTSIKRSLERTLTALIQVAPEYYATCQHNDALDSIIQHYSIYDGTIACDDRQIEITLTAKISPSLISHKIKVLF